MKKKATLLLVQATTKERLDELATKYMIGETSLDSLLQKMMDVYEERMSCPRGNK